MTKALENALRAASTLSPAAQDALAAAILDEVRWESTITRADALERLADEALAEEGEGRTKALDPEDL